MKAFFIFGVDSYSYITHKMAGFLKKDYGFTAFAGLIAVKNGNNLNYIKQEKEVTYEFLDEMDVVEREFLASDVTLEQIKKWESLIDEPLQRLVISDRHIGSFFVKWGALARSNMMERCEQNININKLVIGYLNYFEKVLDIFSPDIVFYPDSPASLPPLALMKVCKLKKIPFMHLTIPRIKNYVSIEVAEDGRFRYRFTEWYLKNKVINLDSLSIELKTYLKSFEEQKGQKPYGFDDTCAEIINFKNKPLPILWWQSLRSLFSHILKHKSNEYEHLRKKKLFSAWWFWEQKRYGSKFIKKGIFKQLFHIEECSFIYFPLQMDPETSTMVLAPECVDQLSLIEGVMRNIPLSHKLYVKEHPAMLGWRPKEFYERLKKYPQLELIHPKENSQLLASKADLVITIGGTAGWEAVLMGRKVLAFGDCFFSHMGLARLCKNPWELGGVIREMIAEDFPDTNELRKKLTSFLVAFEDTSIELENPDTIWKNVLPDEVDEKHEKCAKQLTDLLIKNFKSYEKGMYCS